MKFRTEIQVGQFPFSIHHKQNILLLGSCFSENIGNHLEEAKFHVSVNPFGVLYNPFSINKHLRNLLSQTAPMASDICQRGDLFLHFDYHSSFSHTDKQKALNLMEEAFASVNPEKLDVLFITWGTSRVYRRKENHELVSNCHKFPASDFIREDKSVNEICQDCMEVFAELKAKNPGLQIVLNVSPVRHLKDGFAGNQRNKARLLLAAERLESQLDFVTYFPSYEMVMDDLRDYRFYDSDLVHPSTEAVEYIWEKFSDHYFSEETNQLIQALKSVVQGVKHRLFFPESEETQKFAKANLKKAKQLSESHPELDLSREINHFTNLLK